MIRPYKAFSMFSELIADINHKSFHYFYTVPSTAQFYCQL